MAEIKQIQVNGINYDIYSPNVYSTDEIVIGTWLGKPLYRKVIPKTVAANTNTNYTLASLGITNVDTMIINVGHSTGHYYPSLVGMAYSPIDYYISNTDRGHVYLNGQGDIVIQNQNNAERDYFITLEYTKTTDTAPSE